MRRQRGQTWPIFLAFAMGMGGNLHVAVPGIGFIAMLDLAAYIFAIPILLLKWNVMGKCMRRTLLFAFLWTGASMLANAFNFIEMRYWFKCVTLASSSWAMITCAYVVLKGCPSGYLWYLVGAGLSGWISLYYFRNGSLEGFATKGGSVAVGSSVEFLIDKQIYPNISIGIVLGCVLPVFIWLRKLPVFFALIGVFVAGVWLLLHGGSRSSFGIYCAAAAIGAAVLYGRRLYIALAKNRMTLVIVGLLGIGLMFSAYKFMAVNGIMEEGEAQKFESEFGEDSQGAINGRAGFKYAVEDALESFLIGKGWHLRRHSVISNSLSCEGVFGFCFWIFYYCQVLWFVSRRMPYTGKFAAFISVMMLTGAWSVFGSPFGTRHKYFVFMAFVALCRDYPYYGVGAIFDEKLLRRLPHRISRPLGFASWNSMGK